MFVRRFSLPKSYYSYFFNSKFDPLWNLSIENLTQGKFYTQNTLSRLFSTSLCDKLYQLSLKIFHVVRVSMQKIWHFVSFSSQNLTVLYFQLKRWSKIKSFSCGFHTLYRYYLRVWCRLNVWNQNLACHKFPSLNYCRLTFSIPNSPSYVNLNSLLTRCEKICSKIVRKKNVFFSKSVTVIFLSPNSDHLLSFGFWIWHVVRNWIQNIWEL